MVGGVRCWGFGGGVLVLGWNEVVEGRKEMKVELGEEKKEGRIKKFNEWLVFEWM